MLKALGNVESDFLYLQMYFNYSHLLLYSVGLGSGSPGRKESFNYLVTSVKSQGLWDLNVVGKVRFCLP